MKQAIPACSRIDLRNPTTVGSRWTKTSFIAGDGLFFFRGFRCLARDSFFTERCWSPARRPRRTIWDTDAIGAFTAPTGCSEPSVHCPNIARCAEPEAVYPPCRFQTSSEMACDVVGAHLDTTTTTDRGLTPTPPPEGFVFSVAQTSPDSSGHRGFPIRPAVAGRTSNGSACFRALPAGSRRYGRLPTSATFPLVGAGFRGFRLGSITIACKVN